MVYGYFNGKVLGLRVSVSVRKKDDKKKYCKLLSILIICINITNITIFYVYPRIGLTDLWPQIYDK